MKVPIKHISSMVSLHGQARFFLTGDWHLPTKKLLMKESTSFTREKFVMLSLIFHKNMADFCLRKILEIIRQLGRILYQLIIEVIVCMNCHQTDKA